MPHYLAKSGFGLFLVCTFVPASAVEEQGTRALNLCELVEHWRDYDRHTVKVRAILAVGAEQAVLYDPACRGGADLAADFSDRAGKVKRLDKLLPKDHRAWVALEGVFHGPEPYDYIDPALPAPIKATLARSHKRYGHLDAYDYMIEVTRVVEVAKVGANVPGFRGPQGEH